MVTRRTLLAAGAGAAVVGASGCLTEGTLSDLRGDDDSETRPEWCPDEDANYQCGEGDPLEVEKNFDDDEDVRYHENGTVDVVMGSSGGEPWWENLEFETWAGYTCPSEGAREAIEYTRKRLENEAGLMTGIGGSISSDDKFAANFTVYTGDEVSDPVSFEEVVETAPAYVDATITLADQEHECTAPVYVTARDSLPQPD